MKYWIANTVLTSSILPHDNLWGMFGWESKPKVTQELHVLMEIWTWAKLLYHTGFLQFYFPTS